MRKILLASDGSGHADEAAWFLSHLVHDEKLELIVCSVLPPNPSLLSAQASYGLEDLDEKTELAKRAHERVATMFEGANVDVRHLIRVGRAGEVIVDVAKNVHADLVVAGAMGHSGISRMLLGSTSDYIATHAECSVLVVRPTGLRDSDRRLRIALGYDETGPAQAATEELAEFRWGRETDIDVLTVLPAFDAVSLKSMNGGTPRKAAEQAIAEVRKQLIDVAPVTNGYLLENTHVGDALVSYAELHQSDLIVVGETQRSQLGRFLMGSVSRFVLRHAPCSVWITRGREIHGLKHKEVDRETSSL